MKGRAKEVIFKYDVKFSPEVEQRHQKKRISIFAKARSEIKKTYELVVYEGDGVMYSTANIEEEGVYKAKIREQEYDIRIKWVQLIEKNEKDFGVFYGVFVNYLFRKLNFRMIGRKHFDTVNKITLNSSQIWIMPGYASSVGVHEDWALLNLDVSHRVLREDTAYDIIRSFKDENKGLKIKNALEQSVVLTSYNNSTYSIKEVIFSMSPKDKFLFFNKKTKEKKEISYIDYYKEMYGVKVKDKDQPLLKHFDKRQRRDIYLIPELWKMTGLSDDQRRDFRLMKEMGTVTHKPAHKRMQDIKSLFETIKQSEKCTAVMKEWNIEIDQNPIEVKGYKLDVGKFIMGYHGDDRKELNAEGDSEIDRKIQTKMYEEGRLKNWYIFWSDRDSRHWQTFKNELK